MTNKQIARAYREAKNKTHQIEILSQMEGKEKKEIEAILVSEGEQLPPKTPGRPKKIVAKKTAAALNEIEENKTAAVKIADVPDDIAAGEVIEAIKGTIEAHKMPKPITCNCEKEPSEKPNKLRKMPEAVYTALHNELLRLDKELADILRRKQEIRDFFIEEGTEDV